MHIRKYGNITLTSPQSYESGGLHPYHHEILYVSSGEVQLDWQDRIYKAKGPALFFLTPNTTHQLTKISPHYSFLFMEAEMRDDPFLGLSEIIRWNAMQSEGLSPSYAHSVVLSTMNQIRNHLESELAAQPALIDQLVTTEIQKVVLLVRQIVSAHGHDSGPPESTKAVESLMHFMESFYREEITMKDLADLVYHHPSYLIRLFKQSTGMTPFQYLNRLRMNAAINHLSNSDLPIQDIVRLTGYGSIHYFSRLFKNTYGVSPSMWRQQQRENAR
ncbi:helix-turn-helix domain-containing protein [Cohnella soli]|uniref:Helix-turn-helix domain-containing protein n=1 Tax=Cohnella soli TaxID=425005 RepID=A0ABW0I066_9BACL